MRNLFSISLKRRATLGRLPRCGRAAAALPRLWQRSLPEVNPGVHPWSLPTRDSWMWRISPRETSWRASAGVIATTAKSPEPRMFLFPFFFCCHHSWHTCRLYYQQSPGLQETHGNWLSGLAPSLHLANACRPRPPDVTFPDDGKGKKKEKRLGWASLA